MLQQIETMRERAEWMRALVLQRAYRSVEFFEGMFADFTGTQHLEKDVEPTRDREQRENWKVCRCKKSELVGTHRTGSGTHDRNAAVSRTSTT